MNLKQENPSNAYGSMDTLTEHNGELQVKSEQLRSFKGRKMTKDMILKSSIFIFCSAIIACVLFQRTNLDDNSLFSGLHSKELNLEEALVSFPEFKDVIKPSEILALTNDNEVLPTPFSNLDPVKDLHLSSYARDNWSSPSEVFGQFSKGQSATGQALPTNMWYENLVLLGSEEPSQENRIYTVPYVIGVGGQIAGLKVSATRVLGMDMVVQVTYVDQHSLTLGATHNFLKPIPKHHAMHKRYTIDDDEFDKTSGKNSPLTPLGITLKWKPFDDEEAGPLTKMSSSLVRGMPYGTMHYHYDSSDGTFSDSIVPTVLAEKELESPPIVDDRYELKCTKEGSSGKGEEMTVFESVELTFHESDYTWLVFYSEPVSVRCYENSGGTAFVLQVTGLAKSASKMELQDDNVLTSRIALMNNCTRGSSPTHCVRGKPYDRTDFGTLLKKHAPIYPGLNTKIDYTFFSQEKENGGEYSYLQFEWDPQNMSAANRHLSDKKASTDTQILMYSLPHHREHLHSHPISKNSFLLDGNTHCAPTLNGEACLVEGSRWVLKEYLDGLPSFSAPRQPLPSSFPSLAKAINKDISFRMPSYYTRGGGDTYFSGKMLAKLSRILLITEEITDICSNDAGYQIPPQCHNISLPTKGQFQETLDHLRSSTEIWINGTAQTPFVYDAKWGGIVSCGCNFNDKLQDCDNQYPDCPAFGDPGLDFGHAFYNDHHFHQGYHIYAAATVAHFDKNWGMKHYEEVLLLIRDIANPSVKDPFFPTYRMKDWFLGNSWASGIAKGYPNGRNQESSSESIAAYEAVSLYGQVMTQIWDNAKGDDADEAKALSAHHIRDVGRLLLATELRSADRYWHVRHSGAKSGIYPPQYKPFVVGIMWNMMAQFQTWFGAAPHLAYGIQLLPLTPISERRDELEWSKELYPSFAKSCADVPDCREQGWGILQHAILATVGHPKLAIQYAESLADEAYTSAGGNGHSLTNTIWYYATRPSTDPLAVKEESVNKPSVSNTVENGVLDCDCPETCTAGALDSKAGGFTCGKRISWLMTELNMPERDACSKVAGVQFTDVCAGCDPDRCIPPRVSPTHQSDTCPPCSKEQCKSTLNKCPPLNAPFMCLDGVNKGGCSMTPWRLGTVGGSNCNVCCEVTYNCE